MRLIGFSTGALARSDFKLALFELGREPVNCVELSALRFPELRPLLESIAKLDLRQYRYVSIHAPSHFEEDEEMEAFQLLKHFAPSDWPIVIHPDAIRDFSIWRELGNRIAVENMDRRKPLGRTASELKSVFVELPDAGLCFDIGHARQFDTTMTEAYEILRNFGNRLWQVHVSEVNSASRHDPLSFAAIVAFEQVANLIPLSVPLIIESRIPIKDIKGEIEKTGRALSSKSVAAREPEAPVSFLS